MISKYLAWGLKQNKENILMIQNAKESSVMITLSKNVPDLQGNWFWAWDGEKKTIAASLFTVRELILFCMHVWVAAEVFHCSVLANSPFSWDHDKKMPSPKENVIYFWEDMN